MTTDPSADFPDRLLAGVAPELVERFHLDRLPFGRPSTSTVDLMRLDGRRALVTGGGGDGLGYATCHRLAEQGARVAVLDLRADAAAATAASVSERWGVETMSVTADVGNWDEVQAAVATVVGRWGGIDVLVNNAGGGMNSGPDLVDLPYEILDAVVRLNLYGPMLVTKAVLGVMIPAGSGRIVNVASEGGKFGAPGAIAYYTAKSGVIGFTANLAHEIGPHGVSVVAVCPGLMVASRTLDGMRASTPERIARLAVGFDRTTLGRCSLPDEVASVIAFLASDAGSYAHGTAVSVGGGMSD